MIIDAKSVRNIHIKLVVVCLSILFLISPFSNHGRHRFRSVLNEVNDNDAHTKLESTWIQNANKNSMNKNRKINVSESQIITSFAIQTSENWSCSKFLNRKFTGYLINNDIHPVKLLANSDSRLYYHMDRLDRI